MKLIDWLNRNEVGVGEFAQRIGRHRVTVSRYLSGDRTPRTDDLRAIARETGGAVTANDFYGLSAAQAEAPAAGPGRVPMGNAAHAAAAHISGQGEAA